VSPIPSTEKVVDELLTAITSTEDEERSFVPFKSQLSCSLAHPKLC
jgi:triose/dihydroxyacetone kinase / FAD-AMP lyase (cyclizing)